MLQEGAEGFEEGLEGLADDYVDSDDDGPADLYSDDDDDEASDDADCGDQQHAGKRKGLAGKQQRQQQPDKKRQKHAEAAHAAGSAAGPASVEPAPPSFSQIDLSLPEAVLRRQFPRFPGVAAAQEVLLQVRTAQGWQAQGCKRNNHQGCVYSAAVRRLCYMPSPLAGRVLWVLQT